MGSKKQLQEISLVQDRHRVCLRFGYHAFIIMAHCDHKTQNILIEIHNGVPVCCMAGFGITPVLSDQIVATKMFKDSTLRVLSVPYAAPEAFLDFRPKRYQGADFKKYDIFSYACAAYQLMTRLTPWSV